MILRLENFALYSLMLRHWAALSNSYRWSISTHRLFNVDTTLEVSVMIESSLSGSWAR